MALPLSYNWRNLLVRKTTTTLTVLVIAAVVGVFAWLMGFRTALTHSLSFANDQHKLIVLKQGATSETNSAIPTDEYNKLTQLNREILTDTAGEQLKSPEMIVQVSLPRVRDGGTTNANVAVRGVTDEAFKVHPNIKVLGEKFRQGALEVIVGQSAAKQFAGLEIGQTINLGYSGNRGYKIVGYFSAGGGPMESEIWGPLTTLMSSYQRTMYSSVGLRLAPDMVPEQVVKTIEGPAIELTAQTEPQYWEEQSKNVQIYLMIVSILVAIMCAAAAFSIANTMFASVAGRVREFAMLRTIGFSSGQILVSVIIEAVLLSILGGMLGCLGCVLWLELAGNTKDMFGRSTFTTMAFEIHMTPWIVFLSLVSVAVVGVLGAVVPAIRAARIQVVTALRQA